ncbi:TetR/AcrR family transcriptional regulator [Dyella sp. Tek66A03]|uniref:TetR/AcrR family transcriptional regulator n=1 Tax=Dyella sp. Tek66A03 TaxID=3458298 RepID=UPI00403E6B7E
MPAKHDRLRPSSHNKRALLLSMASELLLARGYAAMSLDELVRNAGQSKTNVYSWFGGKEGLFLATIDDLLTEILNPLLDNDFLALPLEDGLRRLADGVLTAVLGTRALALHRLVIAESPNFPEVAEAWFKAGPERTYAICTSFIAGHQKAGRLRKGDAKRAAVHFHDMLTADLEHRLLLGLGKPPRKAERSKLIDDAIDTFLHGHAR